MKICFIGEGRSVDTQRWVEWFARKHQVNLISTAGLANQASYATASLPHSCVQGTRLVTWVREILRGYKPDLVHSHYINEAGWLGAASGWRPLVITAWGSDLYRAPTESLNGTAPESVVARHADYVTCDSDPGRRARPDDRHLRTAGEYSLAAGRALNSAQSAPGQPALAHPLRRDLRLRSCRHRAGELRIGPGYKSHSAPPSMAPSARAGALRAVGTVTVIIDFGGLPYAARAALSATSPRRWRLVAALVLTIRSDDIGAARRDEPAS